MPTRRAALWTTAVSGVGLLAGCLGDPSGSDGLDGGWPTFQYDAGNTHRAGSWRIRVFLM